MRSVSFHHIPLAIRVKHFVIYHSVAKRGPVAERDGAVPFAILTDRPVKSAVGQRVWLISGSGKPTTYQVHYAFTAKGEESGEDEGFRHRLWGLEGIQFAPPARVDQEPWFAEFAASQGNFAFGLSLIRSEQAVQGLERLAQNHVTQAVRLELPMPLAPLITEMNYPDEVSPASRYVEGAVKQVTVNAYERDPAARAACIEHYGCQCVVCGFDFAEYYGELGAGYIHVHHLTPLAELGAAHEVDPVRDLVPVCPNCHAMLHTGDPAPSVEELAEIYDRHVDGGEDGQSP